MKKKIVEGLLFGVELQKGIQERRFLENSSDTSDFVKHQELRFSKWLNDYMSEINRNGVHTDEIPSRKKSISR